MNTYFCIRHSHSIAKMAHVTVRQLDYGASVKKITSKERQKISYVLYDIDA
jgi:hypothetical protein